MKKALLILALLTTPAAAQQPVLQSGQFVTPGHIPVWVTNGIIGDGGSSNTPVVTSLGVLGPICSIAGSVTGAYNQLCLQANLNSAATITLQNYGGASAQALECVINGVTSSCLSSGTPGGSNTQLQYNNSSNFGGVSGVTSNGTTVTFGSGDAVFAGSSSGTTTLSAASTASGTLTLPAATDQLVGRATTDTLTNKTYDTAGTGNTFKINGTGITAISGNTGTVGTTTGTLTSTHCAKFDASGNIEDSGGTCGSGGSPGGSNTDVQFNSSNSFGGDSGFTYAGSGQATLALGTITSNEEALSITGTWNSSGTTFDAPLFMNITNTNSASGSLLQDLQVGGTSQFNVDKSGNVYAFGILKVCQGSGTCSEIATPGGGQPYFTDSTGSDYEFLSNAGPTIKNSFTYRFSSTSSSEGTPDTGLSRDSAGVVDVGDGSQGDTSGTIKAAHATLTSLANTATTSAVCYNTSTGVLTYDGTIGTCNTSSLRFKHSIQPLAASENPLAAVMRMKPISFYYNADQHTPGEQISLPAENLASIDPRLVSYQDGQPTSLRVFAIIGYLTAAIQQQQHEIEHLQGMVHANQRPRP